MIQQPTNPDVVVIGAGAAGIGAGLGLARHGVSFTIIEAKQRVGGRAYSDTSSLGELWDHGCHWFHSADVNVLRQLADKVGHPYRMDDERLTLDRFCNGQWEHFEPHEDPAWPMLDTITEAGNDGKDVAAEKILDRAHPLYPLVRNWCQLIYSADPEDLSTADAACYRDSYCNVPVRGGYGALIARLAEGLPIRLGTPARRISVGGNGVKVETGKGSIAAKAVILAVPARIMEEERIRLEPGIPDRLRQAFRDVPMGHAEKIALLFERQIFGEMNGRKVVIHDPPGSQPMFIEIHPFKRPLVIGHIGGSVARDMVAEGEDAMAQLAAESLVRAFGADVRKHLVRAATTGWTRDPYIGGAYSCALPGRAGSRAIFRESVHDRILMAGEHCHPHYMATAHGAYETGLWAAARAARLLGRANLADEPLWLPT